MNYFIEKTSHSPMIKFENGVMVISGRSIPEDSSELYAPFFEFITEYSKNPLPSTEANIYLEYSNSSTNRSLLIIFEALQEIYLNGNNVIVNWYYATDDQEMYDLGSDFKSLLSVPFSVKEVETLQY